jgi:preprotein translocase subunit SecD
LTEAVVSDSNRRIYLHASALATNADVTSASVIDMGGQYGVGVSFGDAASARIREGTATHLGKPVAIILDGRVIAAPTLRAPIGNNAVISGSFSAEAAAALAARLSPGTVQNITTPPGALPVLIRQLRPAIRHSAFGIRH